MERGLPGPIGVGSSQKSPADVTHFNHGRTESKQGGILRIARGISCGNCDDIGDVIAGLEAANGDAACHPGRSLERFHFAQAVLLDHGAGWRLQPSQTARRRLKRAWANCRGRDCGAHLWPR